MYTKTECIHLADDFFTKWKLLAEFVIDMKTWSLSFMYDGNHSAVPGTSMLQLYVQW